jgi:hypothetical protein
MRFSHFLLPSHVRVYSRQNQKVVESALFGLFVAEEPEILLCESLMVGDAAPQTQSRDESLPA